MKLKDFQALLSRLPKGYEIEPVAIITDPISKRVMLIPAPSMENDNKVEEKARSPNPIGFM